MDSSAVLAVALAEHDAERFAAPLASAPCILSWPTAFEIRLVLAGKRKSAGLEIAELWFERPNVTLVSFDERFCAAASAAFVQYGKGLGHPARLNFGDCMAYAVAKVHDVPLLFKGTDFSQTDIRPALP